LPRDPCALSLGANACSSSLFFTIFPRFNFLFRYAFYDGPPFATGLPHYGHILAGTIKDIVTRFAHQSGFHVDRRFGWDCHGLPVVSLNCIFAESNYFRLNIRFDVSFSA